MAPISQTNLVPKLELGNQGKLEPGDAILPRRRAAQICEQDAGRSMMLVMFETVSL